MAKVKVEGLTNTQLDWAVAQCEGKKFGWKEQFVWSKDLDLSDVEEDPGMLIFKYSPTTNWQFAGPIIEREKLYIEPPELAGDSWKAFVNGATFGCAGATALIAAMRCYVGSKLGSEIEVPDAL